MFKFFSLCVLAAAALYGGVLYWPGVFFNNRLERGNFVIVSRSPVPDPAGNFADKAVVKLKNSQLYTEEQKIEVYVSATTGEYAFFAPFCRKEYACLHPLKNIVFMAPADFVKGQVASPLDPSNPIALENLLAREAVKLQIRKEMKPLAYIMADSWKKDGYADLVASYGDMEPFTVDICKGDAASDPAFLPYLHRRAVEYIMAENKIGARDLLNTDFDVEPAIKALKSLNCR